ncbi:insecticidal delta-endotoxin Cry8Ea1 family protein [Echinicola shivajiensis]|uniref:insecticidal delta-endotoxin Cry8Ea1 family protein n=1 Tax=Echinicola shivajiensis TaxID=1035916 RepID=UPI001BFC7B5A|nr:insecticidal delta-endotoxin Cry8Ea1 family protein [Echinicola shivajiensis]
MNFLFKNILINEKEQFLKEKTALIFKRIYEEASEEDLAEFVSKQVEHILQHPAANNIPLASEDDFYAINKVQTKILEASKNCALDEVERYVPLLEDEKIESDFFTFLKAPYLNFKANTGVLVRKTNKAEIIYFFDAVMIDNGNVVHLKPALPEMPSTQMLTGGSDFAKTLIKKLFSSAAGAIGGQIGSMILSFVMQEIFGAKSDSKKMIDEVKKVVREEIHTNEIEKINAGISGFIGFMMGEYQDLKDASDLSSKEDRKDLTKRITDFLPDFYTKVIALLMSESYKRKSLQTFQTAAAFHLIILQELALVDPKNFDPNESSYSVTLHSKAKEYHTHISDTFNAVISDRKAKIRVFSNPFVDCQGNMCVSTPGCKWCDDETGYVSGRYYNTKNGESCGTKARRAANYHTEQVVNQLTDWLGNPNENSLPYLEKMTTYVFPSVETVS